MESPLHQQLDDIDVIIRYDVILTIWQALFYGIYLCLFLIAVHSMVTNGLQSRARKWILASITFLFAAINAYWIYSVVSTFPSVDPLNNILMACYDSQNAPTCVDSELTAALGNPGPALYASKDLGNLIPLVNFIIADGVVVWRVWVLCSDQRKVVLVIPVVMLAINTVTYLSMVVVTAIQFITNDYQFFLVFVGITSVTLLMLSLIINIYSTSIIALKAWKYRKLLMESGMGVRTPRQAIKILALLVESGVIYILIGVTSLASFFIFINSNFTPPVLLVGIYSAGIYPIVVVLLVEKNRSLDTTYRSFGTIIDVRGDQPLQAERMTSAPRPILAPGDKIYSGTKPPSHDTDNRITFNATR